MFPPGLTPPETGLCLITAEAAAFKVRQEQHAGSERAGENRRQRPRWSQRPVPRSRGGGCPGAGGRVLDGAHAQAPGCPCPPLPAPAATGARGKSRPSPSAGAPCARQDRARSSDRPRLPALPHPPAAPVSPHTHAPGAPERPVTRRATALLTGAAGHRAGTGTRGRIPRGRATHGAAGTSAADSLPPAGHRLSILPPAGGTPRASPGSPGIALIPRPGRAGASL